MHRLIHRVAAEPPFRLLGRWAVKHFCRDQEVRGQWGVDEYTAYQVGIVEAAHLAKAQKVPEITVVEFGVASGRGLLAMERYSREIEIQSGVSIKVVGFDSGAGLPTFIGDYRDQPDQWKPGDYRMDWSALSQRLEASRTRLILGNVQTTVEDFLGRGDFSPLGFVSFDLDLYSSTTSALAILASEKRKMLRQVPLYFDDIDFITNHSWAGELLAIAEFNSHSKSVKIDHWYGIKIDKPFPEQHHWGKLYVAHDLDAISALAR